MNSTAAMTSTPTMIAIQKTGIVKMASAVKVLGKVFKGLRKDLIYVNEKALSVGADLMRDAKSVS